MKTLICNECGVELEDSMDVCPLCETPVVSDGAGRNVFRAATLKYKPAIRKKHLLRRILWQITSVLLLSGIIATLIINLAIQGSVTWSVYPVSICLIVFSYASLMALWHTRVLLQVLTGWCISAIVLVVVSWYIPADWPLKLALPILCAVNIVGLLVNFIVTRLRVKGLNILAIIFVAISALCLMIEGVVSYYFTSIVTLQWSVIVAACLLPVTVAILFMYFRTRNNADLQKIFHT